MPWAKEQEPRNDNMEKYDKLLSWGTCPFPTGKCDYTSPQENHIGELTEEDSKYGSCQGAVIDVTGLPEIRCAFGVVCENDRSYSNIIQTMP